MTELEKARERVRRVLREYDNGEPFSFSFADLTTLDTALTEALEVIRATRQLVADGAADGFTDHAWMDRLFRNQAVLSKVLSKSPATPAEGDETP